MSAGEGSPDKDEAELDGPEGLLFTGEAIRRLTLYQIEAIGEFANRMRGVEVRPIWHVEQELGAGALAAMERQIPDPIPVVRKEFREFAVAHGFPKNTAHSSWEWVMRTVRSQQRGDLTEQLPSIQLVGPPARPAVELHSLYVHIHHSISRSGMLAASDKQEAFLLALLNAMLQPEAPLQTRRTKRSRGVTDSDNPAH